MVKSTLFLLLFIMLLLPSAKSQAGVSVDISFFYNELAPYGEWVTIDPYGWVWSPYVTNPGWRPYSDGYWAYTDFGWTWVSDVEWGWAAFHYGRWFYDDMYGGVWVPGATWGPAWVAWRYGDGYVGWAPLPPDVTWRDSGELDWGRFDFDVGFQWYWWNFADEKWICKRKLRDHIYSPERNLTLIKRTKNVTRYTFVNHRIIDHGLDIDRFEKQTSEKVPRLAVAVSQASDKKHLAMIKGGSLMMFRPQISNAKVEKIPPRAVHKPIDYKVYHRKLETYHEQQIKKIEKQQKEALKKPGPGVSKEQVVKDQQKAVRKVQEQQKREKQILDNRAKRQQEKMKKSSEPRKTGGKKKR